MVVRKYPARRRALAYESRLELARIMLAGFDPMVATLAAQPFELTGPNGSTDRHHGFPSRIPSALA